MPLIFVSTMLGRTPSVSSGRDELHAVVYTLNGKSVGLVVDQIRDIVDESIKIKKYGATRYFGYGRRSKSGNGFTRCRRHHQRIRSHLFNDEPVAGLLEGS